MFRDRPRRPGAADPDSPQTRARLAAIHGRELRRPPRVFERPPPAGFAHPGPVGYRPQEVPVPDQTAPARPLPTGDAKTTLGRLLWRSRNGAPEDRAAARAELDRRQAARQGGGAA